jgi:hypothetical protein
LNPHCSRGSTALQTSSPADFIVRPRFSVAPLSAVALIPPGTSWSEVLVQSVPQCHPRSSQTGLHR